MRARWSDPSIACLFVAGCGCSDTAREGVARACYGETGDELEEGFAAQQRDERGLDRSGLRLVAVDDETEPPPTFVECAGGMAARAEFIDDEDRHLWVAAEAHHGARDLIPPDIFTFADAATLHFQQLGFFIPSTSLFAVTGASPVVALQSTPLCRATWATSSSKMLAPTLLGRLRLNDHEDAALQRRPWRSHPGQRRDVRAQCRRRRAPWNQHLQRRVWRERLRRCTL